MNNHSLQDALTRSLEYVETPFNLGSAYAGITQVSIHKSRFLVVSIDRKKGVWAVCGADSFLEPTLCWVEPMILRIDCPVTFIPLDGTLPPIMAMVALVGGFRDKHIEQMIAEVAQKNLDSIAFSSEESV